MQNFETLPIHSLLSKIEKTVLTHPNSILKAEPGAGKSTQVPLHLMDVDWLKGQKILLLEPRRLAVRSLAQFLAKQRNEAVGKTVGYQVRNDKKITAHTQLEIITEGILVRRLQQDPELNGVGLIIFDEFHERSLDADLALALCLDAQSALREDLKILIMSATLEEASLSPFLDQAPVVNCPGRAYPVDVHYLEHRLQNYYDIQFYQTLNTTLNQAMQKHRGDALVFLPGKAEINKAISHAETLFNTEDYALIPLYGSLSPKEQNRALTKDSTLRRKIIFSTNIAETSLTIEGITIVIDSGLVRRASYDSSSGMTRMLTQKVSQASATQRAGRAGRLAAGHAYRLWSQQEQNLRPEYEQEAILTSDLTELCLQTALWGVAHPKELRWLTSPPESHIMISQSLLQSLDFLNNQGKITALGEHAMQLGVSTRLAKMLLHSHAEYQQTNQLEILQKACDIAAILSERELLKNSYSANLETRLQAFRAYKESVFANHRSHQQDIIRTIAKEALTNSQNWQSRLQEIPAQPNQKALTKTPMSTAQCVALAYPDRIAKRRSHQDNRYLMCNGKGALLPENDALAQSEYLVIASLDGQRNDGKIFLAIAITLAEIEALFSHHIVEQTVTSFNPKNKKVEGITYQKLGAITLQKTPVKQLKQAEIQQAILNHIKQTKLASLPWNKATLQWLKRVRWLAQYHNDYQLFSEPQLVENFDHWCAPYLTHISTWADIEKLDLLALLQAQLNYQSLQAIDIEAPTHYQAPSNKKVIIQYHTGKQPTVSIQLQELFGEITSPKIAFGQVALSFELLSPAQRPIQITADLAQFWQNSYFDIAKEMRGKYPKHRWPEKPLEEKAGRSLQVNRRRKT